MARDSIRLRYVATAVLCAALVGCGSDSGDDGGDDKEGPYGMLKVVYSPMYSAFDGTHTYQVPVTIDPAALDTNSVDPVLPETINWEVDKAFASVEKWDAVPGSALLTTKKAGSTTVVATAKTRAGLRVRGTAQLTITPASAAEWEMGEARYNNNVMINLMGLGGMMPMPGQMFDLRSLIPADASCANCHNNTSNITVEHTPLQTAGYSDDDLIAIFTMGKKPMGATYNSPFLKMIPPQFVDQLYTALHTWTIAPETQRGIVYKLRSITPKVQSEVDFNRLRMMFRPPNAGGTAGAPPSGTAGAPPSGEAGAPSGAAGSGM